MIKSDYPIHVLMTDDDESFLRVFSDILRQSGYEVSTAAGGTAALTLLEEHAGSERPDVMVLDVMMPGMNGIEVLGKVKGEYPEMPVIMLTGEASIEGAVEAIRRGAYAYLVKPVDVEQLLMALRNASDLLRTQRENSTLRSALESPGGQLSDYIYSSRLIDDVRRTALKVAGTDSTVLITGETGSGKEIAAAIIHEQSCRKDGPFIKVNCAALTETLLESELFGHEKGSYTGAHGMAKGRFELADKGTIFLDEIGEMSAYLQSKLLRVLQEKTFERIGGTKPIRADFRLICATNKDLASMVDTGEFREDLFYRINVIPLRIPPLRERPDDILPIFNYYINKYADETGKPHMRISPAAS
jgi:DNA-binding NtrC family response regulator